MKYDAVLTEIDWDIDENGERQFLRASEMTFLTRPFPFDLSWNVPITNEGVLTLEREYDYRVS
jgi:hypothetical protein